jgi:hypothetical protein
MAALTTSARKSAQRDDPHLWTDREVSELLWTACALRHTRDLPAEQFWAAVECFSYTGRPFESRLLRREAVTAFAREYARALRFSTQSPLYRGPVAGKTASEATVPPWPPPMTALEMGL